MFEYHWRLSKRRVLVFITMILGTGVCGIVIGFAGAIIGSLILRGELFGFGSLAGAIGGMVIGYPIGVIACLSLANRRPRYEGSLLFGILGACLGAVLTMGLAEPLNINYDPNLLFATFFLVIPVLSTAGYMYGKKITSRHRT